LLVYFSVAPVPRFARSVMDDDAEDVDDAADDEDDNDER
jgi:hypothetical protein